MKTLEGWAPEYIKYKVVEQLCRVGDEMVLKKQDVKLGGFVSKINKRTYK